MGSHFPGPGLETPLPPDSSPRQKRLLRCSSFRGAFFSVRRRTGCPPAATFVRFWVAQACPWAFQNSFSVQYIYQKSRFLRLRFQDTSSKHLGSVFKRPGVFSEGPFGQSDGQQTLFFLTSAGIGRLPCFGMLSVPLFGVFFGCSKVLF